MSFDYDLFVIGGGSGGVRAARVAGEGGAKVGLAEESRMGGTCVIRGCVPKKLMLFASGHAAAMADAAAWGWQVEAGRFDWSRFRRALHAELDRLEGVYRAGLDRAGVEVFDQHAALEDAHQVRLADGKVVAARHILIATGGRPQVPADLEGRDLVWTSNDIFDMPALPGRVLIVGGGYIACEFAGILNDFGVSVTQYYRGEQILRGFDDEARDFIAEHMVRHGVNLQVGTDVARVERSGAGLRVTRKDGGQDSFDAVIYATGRSPNSAGLGLEAAGVGIGAGGAIEVDAYSQTSVPSIYAVGDVTGRVNLTPVAIREGAAFVETVFGGNPTAPDHALIPTAIFTRPEYGSVGMTEEQARKHGPIEVYCARFRAMQHAFIDRDEQVLYKLIVQAQSRRILGAHVIAPGAGEMIQLIGIAVKMGATKEDFDRTVAVHPTMSEEIVLMKTPVRSG